MNRRYFLRAAAMPMAVTGLSGCSEGLQGFWSKDTLARTDVTKAIVEKVKTAMFCMQRYSWEHGTAMQGMLEIGDTTNLIIMARESVHRKNPDGRLSMVGSDMNIADTGVNGAGVLAAYKITGEEKYKKAAQAQYEYLKRPESKNAMGVIYHNNKSKVIFSDNMFMVAPFFAQMGDYDEAIRQIKGIRNVLWNKDKKLFHHIRIQETMKFKDPSFWGGGNGWCAAAMAQVINFLPDERKADKQKLIKYCTDVLDGCIAHQLLLQRNVISKTLFLN